MIAEVPKAYGYGRVSHINSRANDNSIRSQEEKVRQYAATKLDDAQFVAFIDDGTHVSAYKKQFHRRPAGKKLLKLLKPGDHLVVDRVDRLWRSVKDFIALMEMLDKRQVNVHIVQFIGGETFKSSSKMGRWVMQMWVQFAELDSIQKAERCKETRAVLRRKGVGDCGKHNPMGTTVKIDTTQKSRSGRYRRILIWDEKKRALMRFIADTKLGAPGSGTSNWTDEKRMKVEHFAAELYDRKVRPIEIVRYDTADGQRVWSNMYRTEIAFRFLGIEEPCQIPTRKVLDLAAKQFELHNRTGNDMQYNSGFKRWKKEPPKLMTVEEVLATG